jgi:hypothetical protein
MELQKVQELSNFFERRVSAYQVGVTGTVGFDENFRGRGGRVGSAVWAGRSVPAHTGPQPKKSSRAWASGRW